MYVASSEPDQDAAEALRFRVLVMASHNELRERQDRLASMVSEGPGFSGLSPICPINLSSLTNGGGGWRAEPVPAQPPGSPPRFVQRDAQGVRLGEAKQPRHLTNGHLIEVSPKLPPSQGHIVEANLQPLSWLPRQARGVESAYPATLRLVEQEEAHPQL